MVQKAVSGMGVFLSGVVLSAIGFPEKATPDSVDPGIVNELAVIYVATYAAWSSSPRQPGFYPITRAVHERTLAALGRARRRPHDGEHCGSLAVRHMSFARVEAAAQDARSASGGRRHRLRRHQQRLHADDRSSRVARLKPAPAVRRYGRRSSKKFGAAAVPIDDLLAIRKSGMS